MAVPDFTDLNGNTNTIEHIPYDLDAPNAREICTVERGTYEVQQTPICQGDCTGGALGGPDGCRDVDDLLAVINQWGPSPSYADVDPPPCGDGVVNVNDLLLVINSWGPCDGYSCQQTAMPESVQDCLDLASEQYEAYSPDWTAFVNKCIQGLCDAGIIQCD